MKRKLILLGLLLVVSGGIQWFRWRQVDPLDRFPHAFIATAGYETDAVVVVPTPLAEPPENPNGLLPAWTCTDPAFADGAGRPWLFPLISTGASEPTPPRHPRLGRSPDLRTCQRHYTDEGKRLLDEYARRSRR